MSDPVTWEERHHKSTDGKWIVERIVHGEASKDFARFIGQVLVQNVPIIAGLTSNVTITQGFKVETVAQAFEACAKVFTREFINDQLRIYIEQEQRKILARQKQILKPGPN